MTAQLLDRRYQITGVLARGGFGQTYMARDTRRPGHPVCVVKQLRPPTDDPASLAAIQRLFNSEAEVLERLGKHDQIPQLLAHFEEDQEFYLVQEFIPGHPLLEELVPNQTWAEAKIMTFLNGILQVLAFVHHQGVIHRDIKPANIIRREPDEKLVLIDFGAVKEITTALLPNTPTVSVGTPAYIPIEQFKGYPQFNSDLYAVGVIAIQAATGLAVDALISLLDPNSPQHKGRDWRSHAQIRPELAALLDKMTHPGYQNRYQTVNDVLIDLQKIVEGNNIAVPVTVIDPVQQTDAATNPLAHVPGANVPKTVIGAGSIAPGAGSMSNHAVPIMATAPPEVLKGDRLHQPLPGFLKALLWMGGGIFALAVIGVGMIVHKALLRSNPQPVVRSSPLLAPPRTPTASPSASTEASFPTPAASSNYLADLQACQETSDHLCSDNTAVFENNTTPSIQVVASIQNLTPGTKIQAVARYKGLTGAEERPYAKPYTVKGNVGSERVYATLRRPPEGFSPGIYDIVFIPKGDRSGSAGKRFVILKNGKIR